MPESLMCFLVAAYEKHRYDCQKSSAALLALNTTGTTHTSASDLTDLVMGIMTCSMRSMA